MVSVKQILNLVDHKKIKQALLSKDKVWVCKNLRVFMVEESPGNRMIIETDYLPKSQHCADVTTFGSAVAVEYLYKDLDGVTMEKRVYSYYIYTRDINEFSLEYLISSTLILDIIKILADIEQPTEELAVEPCEIYNELQSVTNTDVAGIIMRYMCNSVVCL